MPTVLIAILAIFALIICICVPIRKKREAKQRALMATAGNHVVDIKKGEVVGFIDENNCFFRCAGKNKKAMEMATMKVDITQIKSLKYISNRQTNYLAFKDANDKSLGSIQFAWKKDMVAFGEFFQQSCAEAIAKNGSSIKIDDQTEE